MNEKQSVEETVGRIFGMAQQLEELVENIWQETEALKSNLAGNWMHLFYCTAKEIQELTDAVEMIDFGAIHCAADELSYRLNMVAHMLWDAADYPRESPPHLAEE